MSVGSVTSSSLQRDLVTALRQTRAAAAPQLDATAFAAASQNTSATAGTGGTTPTAGSASGPALSSDLMASLLQVQSDYSQIGVQGGLAPSTDSTSAADGSSSTVGADPSQVSGDAAPVHHRHGHHGRPAASDSTDSTDPRQSDGSSAAASASTTTAGTGTSSSLEDGLQSILQQVTKAIAAYASGGPVGLAASALTSTPKA